MGKATTFHVPKIQISPRIVVLPLFVYFFAAAIFLYEADLAGGVSTPPALLVRGFSLACRFCWPRRTVLPIDSAFSACDGRNNGFILRPRPFERGFVREKTHYPSAEATKRSFALRFRPNRPAADGKNAYLYLKQNPHP